MLLHTGSVTGDGSPSADGGGGALPGAGHGGSAGLSGGVVFYYTDSEYGAGVTSRAMILIYLDEAGIAADDPMTTVCGIMVREDAQWKHATDSINNVIAQHAPKEVRDENGRFVPHAKKILDDDYRKVWSLESRIAFLHDLLYIVEYSNLTVAWAYTRNTIKLGGVPEGMRPEHARHSYTFQLCVAEADECIRTVLPLPASGICICEDTDQRRLLQWLTMNLSRNPLTVPGMQEPYRIERMIDTVHFVQKRQAPITALADVCAWALKRYVSGKSDAEPFMRTLLSRIPFGEVFLDLTRNFASGWFTPADPFAPGDATSVRPPRLGWPSQRKPPPWSTERS
jgi:hypothetical protein